MDLYAPHPYTGPTMQRCSECEASMTPQETECLACGASIKPKENKSDLKHRFRTAVKVFLFISAGITAVSLFTPWGPPFMTCIAVTLVLLLVKSSADEMLFNSDKT
jgi:hypothetical protein